MIVSLRAKCLTALTFISCCALAPGAYGSTTQKETEGLTAGVAATRSTVEALSGVISSAVLGSGVMFRVRIAEGKEHTFPSAELPRGIAASAPSPWSLWATPVLTRVDNQIAPLLSKGSVRLFLSGIEYNQDDRWIAGLSVTGDWADISAVERLPPAADARSTVKGNGYTVGPYLVYPLSPEWTIDFSSGIGSNKLTSRSDSGSVSRMRDDRFFVSVGATLLKQINTKLTFTGKLGISHSRDDIGPFVSSTGVSSPASLTELNQVRLGGQFSRQMGSFSPFFGAYLIANDFSVRTTASVRPQEYSSTAQAVAGLNTSYGPFFGSIAYQVERGRSQYRVYAGLRY